MRDTAYHEAGHAAAAYFLGIPFTEVHVIADADLGHLGKLEDEPVAFKPYPREQAVLDELEKRIVASLAGMAAEGRHRGRLEWRYGSQDFDGAFCLARVRHAEGSFAEVEAFLNYVWVRTTEFMGIPIHWAAVEGLAAALLERRSLTQAEASQVIAESIAPLLRKDGYPRSEVERLNAVHNKGVETSSAFLDQWKKMVRRGLRCPSAWRNEEQQISRPARRRSQKRRFIKRG